MPKANVNQTVEIDTVDLAVGEQIFIRYVDGEVAVPEKSGKIVIGRDGQIVVVGFKGTMYYSTEQWNEHGRSSWLKRQMEYVKQRREGWA